MQTNGAGSLAEGQAESLSDISIQPRLQLMHRQWLCREERRGAPIMCADVLELEELIKQCVVRLEAVTIVTSSLA